MHFLVLPNVCHHSLVQLTNAYSFESCVVRTIFMRLRIKLSCNNLNFVATVNFVVFPALPHSRSKLCAVSSAHRASQTVLSLILHCFNINVAFHCVLSAINVRVLCHFNIWWKGKSLSVLLFFNKKRIQIHFF